MEESSNSNPNSDDVISSALDKLQAQYENLYKSYEIVSKYQQSTVKTLADQCNIPIPSARISLHAIVNDPVSIFYVSLLRIHPFFTRTMI